MKKLKASLVTENNYCEFQKSLPELAEGEGEREAPARRHYSALSVEGVSSLG